jgi:hypothetical protein
MTVQPLEAVDQAAELLPVLGEPKVQLALEVLAPPVDRAQ